jgi:CTP synthase
VELPRAVHPYYVATQAHPELSSRPTRPHPLFAGLIKAALAHQHAADVVPGSGDHAGDKAKADAPAAAAKPSSAAVSK